MPDAQLLPVISVLRGAQRGVVVAGATATSAQRRATAAIAAHLQWPLLADVCSGMRAPSTIVSGALCAPLFDVLLSDPELVAAIKVDVVLQVGGRLVSKRLQALVASSSRAHVMIEEHGERMDPDHSVTHRLQVSSRTAHPWGIKPYSPALPTRVQCVDACARTG